MVVRKFEKACREEEKIFLRSGCVENISQFEGQDNFLHLGHFS